MQKLNIIFISSLLIVGNNFGMNSNAVIIFSKDSNNNLSTKQSCQINNRCQQALSLAKSGDYKQLKNMVSDYPYVVSYDKQITFELLHCVMMSGDKDIFAWLLGKKPDLGGVLKGTVNDRYNNSLLHEAIVHKKVYAIELLIKNNSSLTATNKCCKSPIALLYNVNDKHCVQSFNNAFADKFFSTYSYEPYYQEIKKFLTRGFDLNSCDKKGKTLLLRAAQSYPEKCSLLLKSGATVTQEIINSACSTALCVKLQKKYNIHQLIDSIKAKDLDGCKRIIDKDPDVVNREYALHLDIIFCYPLHLAVAMNNITVAQLLLSSNALINAPTKYAGHTSLHPVRSKKMAQLLLQYGASCKSKNSRGETPLYCVLFSQYCFSKDEWLNIYQRCELARYLLKFGADINEVIDNKGNRLLHYAVGFNEYEMIRFLLDNNADVDLKNLDGKSPVDEAIDGKFGNAIKAFKKKGILYVSQSLNIFELLNGDVKNLKNVFSCGKREVENTLAELFMIAGRCEGDSVGDKKVVEYIGYGHCFKNPSFKDLEELFGKDVIDYVKKHLNDQCQHALSLAKNGEYGELKNIQLEHPYVLFYDKQIAFEILGNVLIKGDTCTFECLLNRYSDVSGVDQYSGDTLLHLVIMHKNAQAIALLIKHEISLVSQNNFHQTPLYLLNTINDKECIQSFNNAFAEKFFSTYSYQPYYQEIKKFLKTGFNVNVCNKSGKSLLLRAVQSHPEKCSLLLKHGATVTQEIIDKASSTELCTMLQKK